MTALATQTRWTKHGCGQRPRHGVTKVLRGASWKSGWLIVAHDDRLMPYPDGGYNSAVNKANGGPLAIAGNSGDANGGLRFIALADNVRVSIANAASLSIQIATATYTEVQINAVIGTTTGWDVFFAVQRHGLASRLIDVAFTGTGLGFVGAQVSAVAAPFVRLYGVAQGEVQSTDASNDLSFVEGEGPEVCEYGVFKLPVSAAIAAPGRAYVLDNNTLQPLPAPLLLPVPVRGYDDDQAIIEIK